MGWLLMDRVARSLAVCGLGFLFTASGCRTTRPEVPPGRPYANDGRQRPAIGFSTEPHPVDGSAMANMVPDSSSSTRLNQGMAGTSSRPGMGSTLGAGTASGSFGPPGTSGRAESSLPGLARTPATGDDAVLPAGAPSLPRQSVDPNAASDGGGPAATFPPDVAPAPGSSPSPSQVVLPPANSTGQMGQSNDPPSPL